MSDFEKQYYESSSFWEDSALLDEGNRLRIEETINIIPNDVKSLADIGCGNGVFIAKLREVRPNIQTVGLDRSEEGLKYVKGDKVIGEIINLPFESNSFDCVSCLEVIEHLNVNDFEIALNELYRISKRYIIIGVPYLEKIEEGMVKCPCCSSQFNSDLHLRSFNKSNLERLFKGNGYNLIKFENVVKIKERIGVSFFRRIFKLVSGRKINFDSPICVICGYRNESYKLLINNGKNDSFDSNLRRFKLTDHIKAVIKKIWPTREVPGYWAICLFEKS